MTEQRRTRRRGKSRRRDRLLPDTEGISKGTAIPDARDGPRYPAAAPAIRLNRDAGDAAPLLSARHEASRSADASGGPRALARTHPGFANGVRLAGRTDADFSGSTFHTVGGTTRPAKGCETCGADDCQRVTGKVVMSFVVSTTVTLPTPDPNLTPCQLQRVRNAIRTVLAPHERQHVRAFNTYEGSLTRPFDLTLCSSDFDAAIQSMFDAVEQPRRAAAQAKSDALDPFFFDVDVDCQEPPKQGKRASSNPTDETPEAERPA